MERSGTAGVVDGEPAVKAAGVLSEAEETGKRELAKEGLKKKEYLMSGAEKTLRMSEETFVRCLGVDHPEG